MASVGITVTASWRVSILMVTLREDTIIFPAWKQTITAKQLDEMNDKFEDIEHEQFGGLAHRGRLENAAD